MRIKGKNIANQLCVIGVVLAIIAICIWGFYKNIDQGTILVPNELYHLNENWKCQGDHIVNFPFTTSWIEGREVVYENVLPDCIGDDWAIAYSSNYASQKIYVGDRLIYEYEAGKGDSVPQDFEVMAKLNREDAGKTVRLVVIPSYNGDFQMRDVVLGTKGDILYGILKYNVWRMLAVAILMLLALMILTLAIFHNVNSNEKYDRAMTYFAFFVVSFALWLSIGSDIPQFIFADGTGCNICYFLCFAVLAPAFTGCYRAIEHTENKLLRALQWIGFGSIFLQIVLFCYRVWDFRQMRLMTYGIILLNFFVILSDALRNFNFNRNNRVFLSLFIFFTLVCGSSVTAYYATMDDALSDAILGLGAVLFCLGIFYLLESRELAGAREALKSGLYRNMAYTDALTEMANRMAMERDVDAIIDTVPDGKRIVYVMCDLNKLKYTNDNFGHEAGDELIKNAAICITKAIPKEAHSYRLGGDEFGILLWGSEISAWYIIQKIEEEMEKYNQTHAIKLSMAMGSATDLLQKNKDGFFKELFKRADDQMYEVKRKQHMCRE